MSDSTTPAKSESKPAESKAAESKPAESKSAGSKSAESKPETSTSSSDGGGAGKSGGGAARPISYFSSVSTDRYRAGWDQIFAGKPAPKRAARPKRRAKTNGAARASRIELRAGELEPELRAGLEAAFRRQARKLGLNYDKLAQAGRLDWRIACEVRD